MGDDGIVARAITGIVEGALIGLAIGIFIASFLELGFRQMPDRDSIQPTSTLLFVTAVTAVAFLVKNLFGRRSLTVVGEIRTLRKADKKTWRAERWTIIKSFLLGFLIAFPIAIPPSLFLGWVWFSGWVSAGIVIAILFALVAVGYTSISDTATSIRKYQNSLKPHSGYRPRPNLNEYGTPSYYLHEIVEQQNIRNNWD